MDQQLELANGYSRSHRLYEWGGIILGVSSATTLGVRLASADNLSGWWMPLALFLGILGADLTSGVVHWACDTWGSVRTPILGKLAIRTFREHHVDDKAITRHDFVETNGHNIALSLLPSVIGLFQLEHGTLRSTVVAMSLFSMALWVGMTSQIHKWAHQDQPPRVVRWLQDSRMILAPHHHDVHHKAPHDSNYCITVGWLNGPFTAIGFFDKLERIITRVTGAKPRGEEL
jgi:ubiquitin-conjugating enzyme E2 variant